MLQLKLSGQVTVLALIRLAYPNFLQSQSSASMLNRTSFSMIYDCSIYMYVPIQCLLKMKLTNFDIYRDWLKSLGTLHHTMSTSSNLVVPVVLWGRRPPTHCIAAILMTPDQKNIITGCNDGQIGIWDVAENSQVCIVQPFLQPVPDNLVENMIKRSKWSWFEFRSGLTSLKLKLDLKISSSMIFYTRSINTLYRLTSISNEITTAKILASISDMLFFFTDESKCPIWAQTVCNMLHILQVTLSFSH